MRCGLCLRWLAFVFWGTDCHGRKRPRNDRQKGDGFFDAPSTSIRVAQNDRGSRIDAASIVYLCHSQWSEAKSRNPFPPLGITDPSSFHSSG